MTKFSPEHPIWKIIERAIYVIGAVSVMYFNASDFDETEIKALTELLTVLVGFWGAKFYMTKDSNGKEENN